MRKQILALTIGLMTVVAFGQKKELKAAQKAIKKSDFAGALATIKPLDGMLDGMEPKYKAQYYYIKGQALNGTNDLQGAAETLNTLLAYEKETGGSKYSKTAAPMLNTIIQKVSQKAADAYNVAKDYKTASEYFYLTYKLSPKDTSMLYNAAVSASLGKDYDVALKQYKELQEVGYTGISKVFYAVNKESGVKENVGSASNQKTYVKIGTHINPTTETTESKQGEIVKNIGYIYINQGKTDEAIKAIKEARKADPKDLNLILNEAQLYVKLEDMEKFGSLMEEAIKLDPNNPVLFFNLGVVNQNEEKTEEAIKYYNKAIELKPDYGDAYMNLAVAILSGEQAIIDEMNKNLSNFKKYDELEKKQKDLYRKALPYLEKADSISRNLETVRSLLNIYDILEMNDKGDVLRPIYKKMKGQ